MASVFRFFRTGSFAVSSFLTSIRARLYVAFGFVAALTVLCSLIALYAFTTIGDTTTSIVSRNMPAIVESLRLAEETSQLLASAPRLMTAEDEAARAAVAAEIGLQQKSLLDRIQNFVRWRCAARSPCPMCSTPSATESMRSKTWSPSASPWSRSARKLRRRSAGRAINSSAASRLRPTLPVVRRPAKKCRPKRSTLSGVCSS